MHILTAELCTSYLPNRSHTEASAPYDSLRSGVAYAGGVAKVRGEDTIAEVAPRILALHGCRVLVAGPWRDETARPTVKQDGTDYRGLLTRPGVRLVLNEAAVSWLPLHHTPNHKKGWALKPGEYTAVGLLVVVDDLACCASMVNRHDCGIVVDADDADAHLNALDYLLGSPDEPRRLGTNGKRVVLQELNAKAYAPKLHEPYERLQREAVVP